MARGLYLKLVGIHDGSETSCMVGLSSRWVSPWLMQGTLAGIISCMDFSPDDPNMMAAGSYSSVAAVYDVASGSAALVLSGHKGGLTQVCSLSAKPLAMDILLTSHLFFCTTDWAFLSSAMVITRKCACLVLVLYIQVGSCAHCLFSAKQCCSIRVVPQGCEYGHHEPVLLLLLSLHIQQQ